MRRFQWLFLLALLFGTVHLSSAKAAPARWWPVMERPRDTGYAEDKSIIKAIQFLLRARGQKVGVDGVFGRQTETAIKSFQRRSRLVASGKLNNATWEALIVAPLKQGMQGESVRALQTLLRRAEYDVVVDGKYGPSTRAALAKFQNMRGMPQDGVAGTLTWCVLVDGSVGQTPGH